jgi:hypothetical protein
MLDKLGAAGVVGVLVMLGGIGVLASVDLVLAAGVALVIAGLGMVAYGLVTSAMKALGFSDVS